jgi:hypothetical protein
MRRSLFYAVAAMLVAGTLGLAEPTPARADDGATPATTATNKSDGPSTEDLICTATFSPEPQYSANPGRIHYGAIVQCNYASESTIKVSIENKPPFMPWEPAGPTLTNAGVGFTLSTPPGVTGCVGTTNTKWRAKLWASCTFGILTPYPLTSAEHSYPCG